MRALIIIETCALLAAAWIVWRRSRAETPRRGRAFGFVVLALLLYLGVDIAASLLFNRGAHPLDVTAAAVILFSLQVTRALLLAWAVRWWLEVVRYRLLRSWRGVLVLICLGFIAVIPATSIAFGLLMLLPLARTKWTRDIHGWSRVALIVAFGALTFGLSTSFDATLTSTGVGTVTATLGGGGASTVVEGTLPRTAAGLVALARQWEHAIRVMLVLLRLSILVAFLQMLVVPIRLRGLSLKRRFAVTLAMYRLIPGTLGLVFMILLSYLAIGLHRASLVTHTFDTTLEQALQAAASLDPSAGRPATPSLSRDERSFALVRRLEWVTEPGDTSGRSAWLVRETEASRGTPGALAAIDTFAGAGADTSIGLVEQGGALYLRAAVIRRDGERGTASEVFVALDSTYLARVGAKIHSEIRIDVSPNIFVGETAVRITGKEERGWADSAFTIATPAVRRTDSDNIVDRNTFLARTFLPVGNWLEPLNENSIGAVQMKLYTTPRALFQSLTGNSFMVTSQLFAIVILAGIAFLFFIVEMTAVRTGRSIIKGIVTDVRTLTGAAARFGEGDLSHRVPLSGRDEIGQLAATFNSMAENIEQHQTVLLEKQRLEADLAVAREIQQRMLPQSAPSVPGLDVAGISIPSKEVGGDLFYFIPVSNGRLGITIGDVSGKSVSAALLMSNVLAALRSEARIVDREDEILGHLNRLIIEQIEPGRFVTFFYGVVDPLQGVMRYACAGHNPPLLVRASGETQWLHEADVPLGVVADTTYSPFEVELSPGDVLVLYSDGVTEAQRRMEPASDNADADADTHDAEHEFFDEHRLETAVRNAREKTAAGIIADVMDAVRAFTDGAEASDDLTLVVVRLRSPGEVS